MRKRFVALMLCLVMVTAAFTGCSAKDPDDKGAYITMYLTDEVYNFDPVYAYNNEEAESIVSLLFTRLFTLDKDGDLQYELAKKYTTKDDEKTNEHIMIITLNKTWWSDKTMVTADDVVYAWKRILNQQNSFECAALLFDIKNARAVKEGDCSIDDLGLCALNDTTLQITFEKPIDYTQFLRNLTSLALVPLREDYVSKTEDWAKKPGTMVTSGAFKLGKTVLNEEGSVSWLDKHAVGKTETKPINVPEITINRFVLERNPFFYRDPTKDIAIDKSVYPYRILLDCSRTDEQIWEAYQNGEIFYVGSIPMSLRTDSAVVKKATVTDALSTMSFYMNENAEITNKSTKEAVKLFAIPGVRKALSLVIDRDAIAEMIVFAEAATALVPPSVTNKLDKGSFRKTGGAILSTSADLTAAKAALQEAGVNAADYSFSVIVNANDDEQIAITNAVAEAWTQLGFEVKVTERGTVMNNDYYKPIDDIPKDICDELYLENLIYNDFEVIALDYCAYTADAYAMLAPFAVAFSGRVDSDYALTTSLTGYNSEKYNALMEAIYYLPYFNGLTSADYNSYAVYETEEEFQAVLDSVSAVYTENNINTTKNLADGRATLLHAAEKLLMEDLPIIPVIFNKNAVLGSSKLSGVKSDLYVSYNFRKAKLSKYQQYLDEFIALYEKKGV